MSVASKTLRRYAVLLAVVLVAMAPSMCIGAELGEFCAKAQLHMKQNEYPEALSAVRGAMLQVWNEMPLIVEETGLVQSGGNVLGRNNLRPTNVYNVGEKIYVFIKPAGYTIPKKAGMYQIGMKADFEVYDSSGKLLGGKKDFGSWVLETRYPTFSFNMTLTYSLTGAPAGEYVIKTTIRDIFAEKRAEVETPVIIQ